MSVDLEDIEFERAMAEKVTLQLIEALNKFSDAQNNSNLSKIIEEQTEEIGTFTENVKLFLKSVGTNEKKSLSSLLDMQKKLTIKLETLASAIKNPEKKQFLFTVNRDPEKGWIDTITATQI